MIGLTGDVVGAAFFPSALYLVLTFPNTSSLPRKLVRYCRFRVPSKKIVTHLRIGVDSSTERILYKGRLQTVCRHLLLPLLTEKYSGTQGDFKGFGRKLLTYKYNV